MAAQREIRSACPLANALDILGDRWTLLVLRDLIFYGRREFSEFMGSGEGIASNILSERLERLCCSGLVARFDHPTNGKKYVYRVTAKGADLIPTMIELVLWSAQYLPEVQVPPERMAPLVHDRAAFTAQLKASLLAELEAAGEPHPIAACQR